MLGGFLLVKSFKKLLLCGKILAMEREAVVIAITNQKGGVGKTTTSINLAYYLSKLKREVLLIDLDPQGNASSGLGVNKQELGASMSDVVIGDTPISTVIQQTEYEGLSVAPTLSTLANTEVDLAKTNNKFRRLKTAINEIRNQYDFIIIDCPPSLSLLTVNGLIAADYMIMPVQTEFYALEGLGQLLETMKIIKSGMNPNLEILGVLPTMVDSRTVLSAQVITEIKKYFNSKVFKIVIPRNIRLAEAPSHGVPIGVYDRFSKGAKSYKALAKEVLNRVK